MNEGTVNGFAQTLGTGRGYSGESELVTDGQCGGKLGNHTRV
jgi:hypothetical protein